MTDLTLVPIEDMWNEIASRCVVSIIAFEPKDNAVKTTTTHMWFKGGTNGALGLASKLRHNLLRSTEVDLMEDDDV